MIRTLGTGVSPYNGLARGSFLPALTRFQGFTSDSGSLCRADGSQSAVIVLHFVLHWLSFEVVDLNRSGIIIPRMDLIALGGTIPPATSLRNRLYFFLCPTARHLLHAGRILAKSALLCQNAARVRNEGIAQRGSVLCRF